MTAHNGVPMVVVDPTSGSAVSVDELRSALVEHAGAGRVDWFETGPDDAGDAVAARAVAAGAPTVIACGDDTTVRLCLEAVAGTATSLGIVSLGPGTLLSSNLGLAAGLDAVADAVDGPTRRLDVGEANGEVFAVMAGFGVDVIVGRGTRGGAGAVFDSVRRLWRRVRRVTVHVDGVQRFAGPTASLLVANCPGGPGRFPVVPDADPTDATLDLAVLAPRNPLSWFEVIWRLVSGRPQRPEHVRRFRGDWVYVQSWRARAYELDGDPRPPAKTLDVQVWPDALSVRAPVVPAVEVLPVDGRDVHVDPPIDPPQTDSTQTDPAQTDPAQTGPAQTDPARTDAPAADEPVNTEELVEPAGERAARSSTNGSAARGSGTSRSGTSSSGDGG